MRNTDKERETAARIILKYMTKMETKAALKGYDLGATQFTCKIGDEEVGYQYRQGKLEVKTPGMKINEVSAASSSPRLFRLVRPILKDIEKKINAADPLPHIKHVTPENIAKLPELLSYVRPLASVYYATKVTHAENLAGTNYEVDIVDLARAQAQRKLPVMVAGGPYHKSLGLEDVIKHALSFHKKTLAGYNPADPPDATENVCWQAICKHLAFIKENELLIRAGYGHIAKALMMAGKRLVTEGVANCAGYGDIARLSGEEQEEMLGERQADIATSSIPHLGEGTMSLKWMTADGRKITSWDELLEKIAGRLFEPGRNNTPVRFNLTTEYPGAPAFSVTMPRPEAMNWLVFSALNSVCRDGTPGMVTKYAGEIGTGVASFMLRQLDECVREDENALFAMQGASLTQTEEKRRAAVATDTTVYRCELDRAARRVANVLANLMKELNETLRDAETSTSGDTIPITPDAGENGWAFRFDRSHSEDSICANAKLVFISDHRTRFEIALARATTPASIVKKISVDEMVPTAQRLGQPRYLRMLEDPEGFCRKMKAAFDGYIAGKLREIEKKREEYYEVLQNDFPEDLMEMWVTEQQP